MEEATNPTNKTILEGLLNLFSRNRRWLLFFGTGTSCALDKRLGMSGLAEHLKRTMGKMADWQKVQSGLDAGKSLEQSLTGVGLNAGAKSLIQKAIGDYVAEKDVMLKDDVLLGRKVWAGEQLLNVLVHRLPPSRPRLPVVTSNYDMLIEYSCAKNNIRYTTGHCGDIIRIWNWEQAQYSLNKCQIGQQNTKPVVFAEPLPRVELFKVHGSINRFKHVSQNLHIECDLWTASPPPEVQRVVAAPGDQKYQEVASIVETAAKSNQAVNEAGAFAIIGYGFNDIHLHQQIYSRVRSQDCPLLILTLELAEDKIGELRELGKNVWILVAAKDKKTGVVNEAQALVYPPIPNGPEVLNEPFWDCGHFARIVLGG